MMDAQERQELLFRVERLLVDLAALLERTSPSAYKEAGALVASIVTGALAEPSRGTTQLYADAAAMVRLSTTTVRLPKHAEGSFPYTKPTRHLRDQQAQIERMLAPLSDRRQKAAALGEQLRTNNKDAP